MNWENFLLYGLIGAIVAIFMSLMARSANKRVIADPDGSFTLKMHKFYGIIGILVIASLVVFIGMALLEGDKEMLSIGGGFLGICMGLPGIIVLLYYKNHKLIFDDQSMTAYSWSGGKTKINWDQVQKISFKGFSGLIKIQGEENQLIKAHMHLVGLKTFVEKVEEKTPWTAKELKLPVT